MGFAHTHSTMPDHFTSVIRAFTRTYVMQNNFTYTKIVAILWSSQLHHSEVYSGNSAFAIILDHQFLEGECRILESLNTDI